MIVRSESPDHAPQGSFNLPVGVGFPVLTSRTWDVRDLHSTSGNVAGDLAGTWFVSDG